jgi:hypothetical protein
MRIFERRPDRRLFVQLEPSPRAMPLGGLSRAEPAGVAQDYRHYSLADYQRRRRRGGPSWRDLYPAYAFALLTHAADWPRAPDEGVEDELAAQWERMRGSSRLSWRRARPVVEDAWLALDHIPVAAVHEAAH